MEPMYYAHTPGSIGNQRVQEAAKQQFASSVAPHSGGPLPSLGSQLERIDILRSRVGSLAERLIGPRCHNAGGADQPTVYGGLLGTLETEALALRNRIDAMHADLDAIESALS